MLILDSNTISYYFRGDPQVVPRLQALHPVDVGVPAIVEYELRYGLLRLPEEAAAPRLMALAQLRSLPVAWASNHPTSPAFADLSQAPSDDN
jgi:predicted nucleic acid-binding protein